MKKKVIIPGPTDRPISRELDPENAIEKGVAKGDDRARVGVYGASEFNNGVIGVCRDNDAAGVLGQNDYQNGIGISGTADNGIGIHGAGGQLAGKFEGGVDITGNLTIQGLNIQDLLRRTMQLDQMVRKLEAATTALAGGYQVTRTKSGLRLTRQGSDEKSVIVYNGPDLTPEQLDQILARIVGKLVEFHQVHEDKIRNGQIKAADIGGFLYEVAAIAVLEIFRPLQAYELFAELAKEMLDVNITFKHTAEQNGRFYGAIVDDFVAVLDAILKGENGPLTVSQIVGTLATLYYSETRGFGGLIRPFGTDGWSFIKDIGERVGGATADALRTIGSLASNGWNVVEDAAENAKKFVEDLWPF